MRTKLGLITAAVCVLWGCMPQQNSVKGVVADATINTVTLASAGDTLSFSTLDARRVIPDGLLLGDTATVYYRGNYIRGMAAEELRVEPRRRMMVGGDRDSDGCIGSAGYTWSRVREECIRIFEQGIRLEADGGNGSVFLVFGPDSLKVELFFSNGRPVEILDRRELPGGGYAWNVEDDDTKNVRRTDGVWTVSQRGKVIYIQVKEGDSPQGK